MEKQKVYVVTVGFDYEGESNSGLFATIDAAREHTVGIVAQHRYDSICIEEWDIGGACTNVIDIK